MSVSDMWAFGQHNFEEVSRTLAAYMAVRTDIKTAAPYIDVMHGQIGGSLAESEHEVVEAIGQLDRLIAAGTFDSVLCNGVFGFGVDTRESQLAALRAMWRILKPGGRLLLGWNTDRVEDPGTFEFVQSAFVPDDPIGGGARYEAPEAKYAYDFLRRGE